MTTLEINDLRLAEDVLLADKGNIHFKVPSYQRGFTWDDSEVIDFMKTINAITTQKTQAQTKYMGHLVLEPSNDNYYNIIDGQQRTVAFTLIAVALLQRDGLTAEDKLWLQSIVNTENNKARISVKNEDARFYMDILYSTQIPKSKNRLVASFHAIKDYLDKNIIGESRIRGFVNKLRAITVTCKIVRADEDARLIYADINSKRHIMHDFDLVRSYLLNDDSRTTTEFNVLEEILRVGDNTEKNTRERENFLRDFIKMKSSNVVRKEKYGLYTLFTERYPINQDFNSVDIIKEMIKYAKAYRALILRAKIEKEPSVNIVKGIIPYIFFTALKMNSVMPLLMRLYVEVEDGNISEKVAGNISMMLANYLIRLRAGGETSLGQSFDTFICRAFMQSQSIVAGDMNKLDRGFEQYIHGQPGVSDRQIINNLMEDRGLYKSTANRSYVVLLLCSIQLALQINDSIGWRNAGSLSELLQGAMRREIDHILPNAMTSDQLQKHNMTQDEFDSCKYKLGNLGFLKPDANKNKSNRDVDWFYKNKDNLFFQLNTIDNVEAWTKADIDRRTEFLSKQLVTAWPERN